MDCSRRGTARWVVLCFVVVLAACTGKAAIEQTIVAGGDCMFGRGDGPSEKLAAGAGGRRWEGIAPTLRKSDAFLFNLETTIGQGGTPRAKPFVFRSPPRALDDLR